MAPSHFQPRQHPQLMALLDRILERMQSDHLDAVGVAITVHDKRHDEQPSVLAALGVGADITDAQFSGAGGPVSDALAYQVPVLSPDLWTDDRSVFASVSDMLRTFCLSETNSAQPGGPVSPDSPSLRRGR